MEGPVNGHIYATINSFKTELEDMMTSPLPGNIESNNHRPMQGHRYLPPNSPHNGTGSRSNAVHAERRRAEVDNRVHNDNRSQHHPSGSRKVVDNDVNYYSSSQESNVSKRVAPMWSPSSDITSNQRYDSSAHQHSNSQRCSTQAEIEKLDDLLQELTPRLNDSPSEYLRRRRQSFSNSSKTTTFEGRARQDTFIQGFSPTSPIEGRDNPEMTSNNSESHQVISASLARALLVERAGSHTNLEGAHNKPRYSSWHSEEKKKLQRARSLLDEKDRFLTEQLRRYQTRPGTRDGCTMSPLGYRPGSSQQMMSDGWSGRLSSYANKDYVPASEWEDVRMFSDQYAAGQTRRATSEMDYPLRDLSMDRSNPSPVVGAIPRRRPLLRHYSDKDEINYPRTRQNLDNNYRAYSPHANRYLNGSPAHQDLQQDYTDDIPQVQRRNIRSSVHSSRLVTNNIYQQDPPTLPKIKDRNFESLPMSTVNISCPLSPIQSNIENLNAALLKDMDKGSGTPELLKKSRNSGFQIRADNSARASGISYYDPDDAYLSSDGYPLVSKLSASHSPTEQPSNSSVHNRRSHNSINRVEDPHCHPNFEEVSFRRDCNPGITEPDLISLHPNRQSTNSVKPVNAHNSNNSSIRKSAKIWYQPHMSRDEAIKYLRNKSPGCFIVRQSHTFNNSYGLAVKVPKNNPNDDEERSIRHFLIESNSKGVRIRGCANEPYFGSLTALVHQHTLTKLALPCCIILPTSGLESDNDEQQVTFEINTKTNTAKTFTPRTFVAFYLGSIDTDSLTGISAISKAVEVLLENRLQVKQTEVSIRVSPEGVTLTDVLRKLFFRRHYPLASISYCGVENTAYWDSTETRSRGISKARIFGFVARKTSANENMCHMLCECNTQDSARSITNFIAGFLSIT